MSLTFRKEIGYQGKTTLTKNLQRPGEIRKLSGAVEYDQWGREVVVCDGGGDGGGGWGEGSETQKKRAPHRGVLIRGSGRCTGDNRSMQREIILPLFSVPSSVAA